MPQNTKHKTKLDTPSKFKICTEFGHFLVILTDSTFEPGLWLKQSLYKLFEQSIVSIFCQHWIKKTVKIHNQLCNCLCLGVAFDFEIEYNLKNNCSSLYQKTHDILVSISFLAPKTCLYLQNVKYLFFSFSIHHSLSCGEEHGKGMATSLGVNMHQAWIKVAKSHKIIQGSLALCEFHYCGFFQLYIKFS